MNRYVLESEEPKLLFISWFSKVYAICHSFNTWNEDKSELLAVFE